ncbi:MAG: hypothetical protein M3265_02940 [Actinomycetota bacterium]|nr:hypothetical protein [Actinomycetota bacterium]
MSELAWTVGRDRRKEARIQRRWAVLQVVIGAASALLARRLAERAWAVMTGEQPPILGHAGEPAPDLPDGGSGEETVKSEAAAREDTNASSSQVSNVSAGRHFRVEGPW